MLRLCFYSFLFLIVNFYNTLLSSVIVSTTNNWSSAQCVMVVDDLTDEASDLSDFLARDCPKGFQRAAFENCKHTSIHLYICLPNDYLQSRLYTDYAFIH